MIKIQYLNNIFNITLLENTKFKGDQLSYKTNDVAIYSAGFFLNAGECLNEYYCDSIPELILKLVGDNIPVPKVLHGCYVIVVYQKLRDRLVVFNDMLSKHSVFYSIDEKSKCLMLSDSFFETVSMVKEHGLPCTVDELGVKMMLWHRMFYDDETYVKEIKFLRPFDYLVLQDGALEVKRIARDEMLNVSMEEAACEIDQRFNKAVALQFKKNETNGYPQVATLSGGMDSRSTFLYGLSNGYINQTCFCYGESTSADYEYAKDLAIRNGCSYFFHPIDNGSHLLERDEICEANEGQMVYSGPSGTYDSLRFYDTSHLGIIHTGLGGGEIMGDMRVAEHLDGMERLVEALKYKLGKGKKDRTWESFVNSLRCNAVELQRLEACYKDYFDFNEFQSLNDIRRCLNSQKIAQSFGVEYVSPFLDEDFFCYMLRIPYELTKDRKLYIYWQKKYNPKQFETPSTFQLGCKPGNKLGYYAKRLWKYALNRMGRKTKDDMNPYEFWLAKNPSIANRQETMFSEDIAHLGECISLELRNVFSDVWMNNGAPRPNILTASWALRKFLD